MTDPVIEFYDRLGPEYRDNMGWDWDEAVRREGATLHRFIESVSGRKGASSMLDCTCGIGTQAIGLALQGHRIHATDLSPISVDCARREAERLGAAMTFGVADFRKLEETVRGTFEVVLTCDNAIAHCLEDEDLYAALASMKMRLNRGGLLLFSLRHYGPLVVQRPRFNNEHVQDKPDGRRIVFQLWDWAEDGRSYRNHQFLIKEVDGAFELKHFETELRALRRKEVLAAVREAGYAEVRWNPSEASGYYQPIVTARNE